MKETYKKCDNDTKLKKKIVGIQKPKFVFLPPREM
jgi:hypothetical protein